MPELPEVETMRRGVLPIVGATIERVTRPRCRLRPILLSPAIAAFRRRAVGRRILAVDRLGKRVIVRLDSDDAIVLEPRMTGLVLLAEPPNETHLRLVLELSGVAASRLMFWDRRGLGSVRLLDRRRLEEAVVSRLGPDALAVTCDALRERFRASRREVKVALLDQQALAGVGNLYASEILHLAGVHPQARCHRLRKSQWSAIHKALREVLELAILLEGSTLSDGTYRNALNESGGYQNHHRVYDRAGEPCPRCGDSPIRRIVQAQRSTFFCPRCQGR
ncbi:MAG: bifunctional DNA-formamidopyrimidine glycosylase/DNA-(apurinic or apyrimidinic site) lyase [Pirellulaceae bacterium]